MELFSKYHRYRHISPVLLFCLIARCAVAVGGDSSNGTVRVAAIQCYSKMGAVSANRAMVSGLVKRAAGMGARIVVTPECAVQGYMDPVRDIRWASGSNVVAGTRDIKDLAEPVPGPSTHWFGTLAGELKIYLCLGLAEIEDQRFYNAQVLFNPHGIMVAHHRKKLLWTPGDGSWATAGDLPVQVVETEYGRLGLMVCYEFHQLPRLLRDKRADIVLYSVGWYAPNPANWYEVIFPRDYVAPYGFDIVVANWCDGDRDHTWPGTGYSCVIRRDGKVLNMTRQGATPAVVIADLAVSRR